MASAIEVSDTIRQKFLAKARKVMEKTNRKVDDFNQEDNALTLMLVLVELGCDLGDNENKALVLQALKVGGNASANRQRLQAKAEPEKAVKLATDLIAEFEDV